MPGVLRGLPLKMRLVPPIRRATRSSLLGAAATSPKSTRPITTASVSASRPSAPPAAQRRQRRRSADPLSSTGCDPFTLRYGLAGRKKRASLQGVASDAPVPSVPFLRRLARRSPSPRHDEREQREKLDPLSPLMSGKVSSPSVRGRRGRPDAVIDIGARARRRWRRCLGHASAGSD